MARFFGDFVPFDEDGKEVTVSKLEEMLQGAGMSQDQAHQLIQIIDVNHDKSISMEEFTLAPFDPMWRVLAGMAVSSSSKDTDFWAPMLDLKCAVMRSSVAGFSKTRAAIEELVDASSESLSRFVCESCCALCVLALALSSSRR